MENQMDRRIDEGTEIERERERERGGGGREGGREEGRERGIGKVFVYRTLTINCTEYVPIQLLHILPKHKLRSKRPMGQENTPHYPYTHPHTHIYTHVHTCFKLGTVASITIIFLLIIRQSIVLLPLPLPLPSSLFECFAFYFSVILLKSLDYLTRCLLLCLFLCSRPFSSLDSHHFLHGLYPSFKKILTRSHTPHHNCFRILRLLCNAARDLSLRQSL